MNDYNLTFTWRTLVSLRDWLKQEAKKNGRSMNAQLSEIVLQAKKEAKKTA